MTQKRKETLKRGGGWGSFHHSRHLQRLTFGAGKGRPFGERPSSTEGGRQSLKGIKRKRCLYFGVDVGGGEEAKEAEARLQKQGYERDTWRGWANLMRRVDSL